MEPGTENGKLWVGASIILVGMVVTILLVAGRIFSGSQPQRFWVAGGAALGLLSGFTTGISTKAGSGMQFVQFISAGILVPIIGTLGTLVDKTKEVTQNTEYVDDHIVHQTTRTVTLPAEGSLHPVFVLGSFLAAFGLAALLGVAAGALLRKSKVIDVMNTP